MTEPEHAGGVEESAGPLAGGPLLGAPEPEKPGDVAGDEDLAGLYDVPPGDDQPGQDPPTGEPTEG